MRFEHQIPLHFRLLNGRIFLRLPKRDRANREGRVSRP
jgi:hypothetical protein